MKHLKVNGINPSFTPVGSFPQKLFQLFLLSKGFAQGEIEGWHSGPKKHKLQVNNGCLEE